MAHTVLLVEDEQMTRTMLRKFFESHRCRVVEVEDGAEAFALVQKKKPDLIVMDLSMPDIEGLPAVHVLRDSPSTSDIPIIIYSGTLDDPVTRGELGVGPRLRFMRKPGDLDEMWQWAKEMMS
ncbi:MAG: response regulator [Elusimicrobiota bacterium]